MEFKVERTFIYKVSTIFAAVGSALTVGIMIFLRGRPRIDIGIHESKNYDKLLEYLENNYKYKRV